MSHRILTLLIAFSPLAGAEESAVVARGKYLAEQAIACQECHSPKLESGEYDKTK